MQKLFGWLLIVFSIALFILSVSLIVTAATAQNRVVESFEVKPSYTQGYFDGMNGTLEYLSKTKIDFF